MDPYSVTFKKSAEKDLRAIPREMISHIFEHIEKLATDPLPHGVYKLASAEHLYRIRTGDYRVIYQVLHESREIVIYYIRHRSVAYRGL